MHIVIEENQKNNWVPTWVKPTDDGNHRIVQKGANWLPQQIEYIDLSTLIETPKAAPEPVKLSNDNGANHPNGLPDNFYDFFLLRAERECSDSPKTVEQLNENWQVHKPQLKAWLTRATEDGKMEKLDDTQGYRWIISAKHESQAIRNLPTNCELAEQAKQLDMLESEAPNHDQAQTQPTSKSA